jgi:hypothetical protein
MEVVRSAPYFLDGSTTWNQSTRTLTVTAATGTFAAFGNLESGKSFHIIINYTKSSGVALAYRSSSRPPDTLSASGTLNFTDTPGEDGLVFQASGGAFTGTITLVSVNKVVGPARRFYVRPGHASATDAHTSTQAQDPTTPMNTIAAAVAYADRYRGDQVLVAEGTTTSGTLPNLNPYSGFSAVYPFVIQTYDPADPTNETKMRHPTTRAIVNTGSSQTNVAVASNDPAVCFAYRGLDFSPTSSSGLSIDMIGSGGLTNDYVLVENNIFRHTQVNHNQSGTNDQALHHVIRANSLYGCWSATSNAEGFFLAGGNFTVEDNVLWHVGWKVGASRDADQSLGGCANGPELFRHAVYQQYSATAIIRRNLIADPCTTGLSARGPTDCQGNIMLRCPIAAITGGGDNYDVHRPVGVPLTAAYNAVLGNRGVTGPSSTNLVRVSGFTSQNGTSGSSTHHNVVAYSQSLVAGGTAYSTNAITGHPSYNDVHDNVEYNWAASSLVFTEGGPDPTANVCTYSNNRTSASTGPFGNTHTTSFTNAYTEDTLAVAMGYADCDALMAYAIDHPEAFLARPALPIAMAGYGISTSGYTP